MISFESPDLESLLVHFTEAQKAIDPLVSAVLVKGAVNIKKNARALFTEQQATSIYRGYLPRYASTINFDVLPAVGHEMSVEIGPVVETNNQGAFGPGIEFGSSKGARVTPPMPHLIPALEGEAAGTQMFIGRVAETAIFG